MKGDEREKREKCGKMKQGIKIEKE